MRLNSLVLTNFRQHAQSTIEFDTGLTGIIGPNGAGKSTILEAVAWALYGQGAARGNRDSIRFVRAGARSSVRVELDFELGGHRYRVVRGLNNAELFLDGSDAPIANSIGAVNDLLQRRLGMSRTEFFHTYFTGQKELNVMSSMGPTERSQFLSRVLGYERLRVAQESVRERKRLLAAELTGIRTGMPDADAVSRALNESGLRKVEAERALSESTAAFERATRTLSELTPGWTEAQAARDRYQELSAELRVVDGELAALQRDKERLDRELDGTATAREELERLAVELAPLATYSTEHARLEELARAEGRRQTLNEAWKVLSEELIVRRARRSQIAGAPTIVAEVSVSLDSRRRMLEETLEQLEQARTEWVRDRQEAETKRDALRTQYAEIKKQRDRIVELGEDGACPTCTRVLGENFRTVLDQVDEQLDTITVDGRYFATRLTQLEPVPPEVQQGEDMRRDLQREIGDLEGTLARLRGEVQELTALDREVTLKEERLAVMTRDLESIPEGYDATRHLELRAMIDGLAAVNDRATRFSAQLEREPELLAEHERVVTKTTSLQERLAHLHTERDTMRFSERDFIAARDAQEAATRAVRDTEVKRAGAAAELKAAARAVEGATAAMQDLQRLRDTEAALARDRKLHQLLDDELTDLRTDLNHALRPELSELASAFLAELTDHRYSDLELDDDYNIVVSEDGRPKPVISGGEEDLANLVLRLAISQMIAERAGQAFSLLVLDEIFGSLDDVRRHNVVELLRRLNDRFEQVVLITHIEAVRDGMDRVIALTYDEETGSSVVRDVSAPLPDAGLFGSMALVGGDREA